MARWVFQTMLLIILKVPTIGAYLMSSSIDNFYQQIQGFARFDQFAQSQWYRPLDPQWSVVVADVQGSTQAIAQGRYKEINSLGVACIVALLNAVKPLKIPYTFGGDGAMACFPPSAKGRIESALVATQQMAADSLGLKLRIGIVPMNDILDAGHKVLVGKLQPHAYFQQAMFLGDGLSYAESQVKNPDPANAYLLTDDRIQAQASFEGFECRWNEVPSPHEETIALLVYALGPDLESDPEDPDPNSDVQTKEMIYSQIMEKTIEIYGDAEQHHPLRPNDLSLTNSKARLHSEVAVRTASSSPLAAWLYPLKLRMLIMLGRWFMRRGINAAGVDWGNYMQDLIAHSNYRQFDEVLRMVISGSKQQRAELRKVLAQYQQEGKIAFGIHASPGALITCMISHHQKDHVHFVDGSQGGYALASVEMKQQLAEMGCK